MSVRRISVAQAADMLAGGDVTVVDIRERQSFLQGHIPGAQLLGNDTLREFLASTDRQRPVIVCCYHGSSSVSAAMFLADEGFTDVCSLDGGYEAWRFNHPVEH